MLVIASVLGAAGVIAGAFGAHGLESRLTADLLETFEVGVRYHMYHAIALFALTLAPAALWTSRWTRAAAWLWLAGIAIFSGSLYVLAIADTPWLGAITPIGGVALIAGWICVVMAALTLNRDG